MQNDNLENKAGQVRRNPSRDNKNINQGQNYEKRVDSETNSNRDAETDKKKFSGNENSMDGGRISDTSGNNIDNGRTGKSQQNAAGEESGNEQTGSQGLQNSRGAQGSNSQGQREQQQTKQQSGESSGRVKNDEALITGSGADYDANEQFDNDEDLGSHVQGASGDEKNDDRSNSAGGQGTLNNMQKNQFEQRQKDKNKENSTRQ